MIRRPPRSTLSSSSAASDVYKRQVISCCDHVRTSPARSSSRVSKSPQCPYEPPSPRARQGRTMPTTQAGRDRRWSRRVLRVMVRSIGVLLSVEGEEGLLEVGFLTCLL